MRERIKRVLAGAESRRPARGSTVLIYHRIGGGSPDERDVPAGEFARQLDLFAGHDVVSLDEAVRRQQSGDERPCVVLTFDDGFADVHRNAWPLLRDRRIPFAIYLATAFVGGTMHWDGSTAKASGPALSWDQLAEMHASGLLTIGNHTHSHVRPEQLTTDELDRCSELIEGRLGLRPRHFAFTWGIPVPGMQAELRSRFDSAATGELGRNLPGDDPLRLKRVPVRRTDPAEFVRAKLTGTLRAERAYGRVVAAAKRVGVRA